MSNTGATFNLVIHDGGVIDWQFKGVVAAVSYKGLNAEKPYVSVLVEFGFGDVKGSKVSHWFDIAPQAAPTRHSLTIPNAPSLFDEWRTMTDVLDDEPFEIKGRYLD